MAGGRTGAERYLAERLKDPEYAAEYDEASAVLAAGPIKDANPAGMTPGPEVDGRPTWYGTAKDARVAGMTEARGWTGDGWSYIGRWSWDEIVQARYPLPPKPKTVRVHWSVADGREDPHDGEIIRVEKIPGLMPRVNFAGGGWMDVTSPDGTVEVLAEDGES